MSHATRIYPLLWRMIRYAPRLYLLDTALWLLIAGLPAIPGLLIREFFDALSGRSPYTLSELTWIVLLLAVGLARIVAIFWGRCTKTQHRFTMSALLQRNLLAKLFDRPGALPLVTEEGAPVPAGGLVSFFRDDVEQLEDNAVGTNELLSEGVFALGSLLLLIHINLQMTLLVFLPLMLISVLVQQLGQRIKRYRRHNRQSTQDVTSWLGELFASIQTIRIAGAEDSVLKHFEQLCDRRKKDAIRDRVLTQILESSVQHLVSLGTGGILLVAAQSMQSQQLSVGDFALFVYYLAYVTYFLGFMGDFLTLSKQSEVSFERMESLLNCSGETLVAHHPLYLPRLSGRAPKLHPSILMASSLPPLKRFTARHISFYFPKSTQGIQDISLNLQQGSLTVITGAVGSGKTTLLQVLLGLLPLSSGTLFWNDQVLKRPEQVLVPPRVAYTPQVPHLLTASLRENILLGRSHQAEDLERAIAQAALDPDIPTLLHGLDTAIGVNGTRLSGGQAQRTAVARMLLGNSDLLVMDDISSALDLETEQRLWSRLFQLPHETSRPRQTYLIVSHRPHLWQRADQIIWLECGQITFCGPYADLPAHFRLTR